MMALLFAVLAQLPVADEDRRLAAAIEERAFAAIERKAWCDAAALFERANELSPSSDLIYNQALAADYGGDHRDALRLYLELIGRYPDVTRDNAVRARMEKLPRLVQQQGAGAVCTPSAALLAPYAKRPPPRVATAPVIAVPAALPPQPAAAAEPLAAPTLSAPRSGGRESKELGAGPEGKQLAARPEGRDVPAPAGPAAPLQSMGPGDDEPRSAGMVLTAIGGAAVGVAGLVTVIVGAQPFFEHEDTVRALAIAEGANTDPGDLSTRLLESREAWETWGFPTVVVGAVVSVIGLGTAAVFALAANMESPADSESPQH